MTTRKEKIDFIYEKIGDKSHLNYSEDILNHFTIPPKPIMMGRCDIFIEKGPDYFDEWIIILDLWEKKDEPIENQSEKCIDYIYKVIKK